VSGLQPAVLLYDWDSTLVDAWGGIAAALNAAFADFGMPFWTVDDTRARARVSLREAFPSLFGANWKRARDVFYAALAKQHIAHLQPMPGADDLLRAGSAWPQGVVSNKNGRYLRAEAAHLGWSGHFVTMVGAGDAVADKPDPAPIRLALERLRHCATASVWYVGDNATDVATARAAGVTAVLLGDAAHDGGICSVNPDLHFDSAAELARRLLALA
jgi:phosphoglycolate phosphatase